MHSVCSGANKVKRFCDCWEAAAALDVKDTYECSADTDCQCPAGFYGNGQTCIPCSKCSPYATLTQDPTVRATSSVCPEQGATADDATCTCNAGYYGDGRTCRPCTVCDAQAATYSTCLAGSRTDLVSCCCAAGYYGPGTKCTACPAGTYSAASCGPPRGARASPARFLTPANPVRGASARAPARPPAPRPTDAAAALPRRAGPSAPGR